MSSLFLRIYFSTLGFLVVAFFAISYFANSLYPKDDLISNTSVIQHEVNQYFKNIPPEEWQDAIHVFGAFAGDFEVSLTTKDDLSESEIKRFNTSKEGVIKGDNRIGDITMLHALPDKKTFLRVSEGKYQNLTFYDWLDIFLPLLLIFITLAFGLFLLIRKLTKPIQHLNEIALKLGQGNLEARAKEDLPKPLDKLANGFNSMAKQLKKTIKEQQILVGAIPHELRSPLGRIRFALDMTRNNSTVDDYRKDIENIDSYVDQMQATVDEILELNRLQNQPLMDLTEFDLSSIINTLTENIENESPSLNLILNCNKSIKTSGNAKLIKRAINNLINNAQYYANSKIQITVYQNSKQTIVQVDDDGIGIDKDQSAEVFSPFSTFSNSRNRKTGGIGLGLAIVKLIMEKHYGKASVSKSGLGGARFELRWNK